MIITTLDFLAIAVAMYIATGITLFTNMTEGLAEDLGIAAWVIFMCIFWIFFFPLAMVMSRMNKEIDEYDKEENC